MTEIAVYFLGLFSGGFVVATGYAVATVRRLEQREGEK